MNLLNDVSDKEKNMVIMLTWYYLLEIINEELECKTNAKEISKYKVRVYGK